MRKKILFCTLLGAPIGLTICTIISIIFSLIYGNGSYFPASHDLIAKCKSELNAVLLQTILALFYGAVWGGASVIWSMEHWSILKMTVTHLIICSVISFPIAYYMEWMPHNLFGACCFFGIFFAIYGMIWLSKYIYIKKQITQINNKVQAKRG